jgi:2,4-dienoyl-CoA reductase-like NADH-dependent reductase (Old Yellow Enzyme family)
MSPLVVGNVTLKNRILSSGHDTVMAHDGQVTDQLVAYHEARAAGGAGLIVVQVAGVHPSAKYTFHVLMADTDACIPGYRRLAETVHSYGTAVFGQLFHGGREIMDSQDGSLPVALAPSSVPNERFHVMPRAITLPLIHEIVAGYGSAAARLQAAGLDGVEVVASHGYLPAQFLNPRTNLRHDEYGGSPDNRLRFLREVLSSVRSQVGPDLVVGIRISADEFAPDGLTVDEMLTAVRALDADGVIDYVSVVAGTSSTLAGSGHIAPPMTEANAYTAPLAAKVTAATSRPVMVAGRINQPHEAEAVVASGQAAATAMTRALICDPDLPVKTKDGRSEEIRACIGCNQACIGHFHAGYPISCIQNPVTGRELRYRSLPVPTVRRRLMVVGGGPGGMKAAVVAAQRGHDVTLYESARLLGGQVRLAERLPGRAEFGGAVTNLLGELERAKVDLRTGVTVDVALVEREAPDVVVIATGATPRHPELELMDAMPVHDAWQVLDGAALPAGRVVVADWRPDWIGLGVAELLARQGHKTVLAVNGYHAGQRLQQYVRDAMIASASRLGVEILPLVRVIGADDDTVYLQHVLTDEPVLVEGVTSLVVSQGHQPVTALYDALTAPNSRFAGEVHGIGDCIAPRTVEEAVLEALQVAAAI